MTITPEQVAAAKTELTAFLDANADRMGYLWARWLDEREYEDWKEYAAEYKKLSDTSPHLQALRPRRSVRGQRAALRLEARPPKVEQLMTFTVQDLTVALPTLPPSKQGFAASLIEQSARRGLSEKQLFWVNKLVTDARQPAPAAAPVGDLSGILSLFRRAKPKFPSVTLKVPATNLAIRVTVAGPNARFPGSLNVTGAVRPEGERRPWFGRVKLDGSYEPSNSAGVATAPAIAAQLARFAADPAGVAAEYGKQNGYCCFCRRKLGPRNASEKASATALKSLAVGYGKDCADSYGLPWGETE